MLTTRHWGALTASIGLALFGGSTAHAQKEDHLPRGEATIVTAGEVRAVMDTRGDQRNIDKAVRTIDTKGPAGIISVGAVSYRASPQNWDGVANEHSKITEVFHVTKGSATFVFGGDLESPKEFDTNSESVRKVFGPGQGGKVKNQRVIKAKLGDNVVLPPHTPHNIIDVSEDFEMVVIRIDPERVLELEDKKAASAKGPWIGTWKRNSEKSSSKSNGTSIFKMWEEGDGFRYTLTTTPPTGEPTSMGAFGRFDGKLYEEKGNPVADHNIFRRVDDRTYSLVDVKNGRDMISFTITISPDGKTRTSVSKSRNDKGEEVTSTGVWDRVE